LEKLLLFWIWHCLPNRNQKTYSFPSKIHFPPPPSSSSFSTICQRRAVTFQILLINYFIFLNVVHFTNILRAAFMCADHQKPPKNTVELSVFFVRLWSACIKAVSKHVDEIDPCNQFHQHLWAAFSLIIFCQKIEKPYCK